VEALRKRGIDVLTPLDAGMLQKSDEEQLRFATRQGRALYTFNIGDFCRLHSEWMTAQETHAGIILARQQHQSLGEQMRRLLRLIAAKSADQMRNQLVFLSDWG
jgi:hypothetical protein